MIKIDPRYRLFLFDFDLTLADGSEWIVACYQKMLHNHGFLNVTDEAARRTIGLTVENSIAQMTGIKDDAVLAELRAEYRGICRPQMAEHTRPFADALDFLTAAHAKGIQLGVVSTKQSFVIRKSLKIWGLEDSFSLVYGLEEVGEPKPSPMGILRAAEQLNVPTRQVLYFGDSLVDGEAAERAGVDFVGVAKGNHTIDELKQYAHTAVITDYSQLSL